MIRLKLRHLKMKKKVEHNYTEFYLKLKYQSVGFKCVLDVKTEKSINNMASSHRFCRG